MDKAEFLEKIKEIGTCEDDVERRTMLSEVSENISKVFDELTDHTNTIDSLNETIKKDNEDMEKLRQANMDLFKRIGADKSEEEKQADKGLEPEKPKRRYEDLFDEKGMIKR